MRRGGVYLKCYNHTLGQNTPAGATIQRARLMAISAASMSQSP